jgi:hypothetical protein
MLSSLDELDCGKRYLCELASMPLAELSPEEQRTITILTVRTINQYLSIKSINQSIG